MPDKNQNPVTGWKIALPVCMGLAVTALLIIDEFDPATLDHISISSRSITFLISAICLMLLRDMGIIWRFRLLTDKKLSWTQAFNVHILSEFTSAITPSAIGGSALVALFMNKEGVSAGRSTAVMFAGLLLDELYFVVASPVLLFFIPIGELFNGSNIIASTISIMFQTIYIIICIWTTLLYIGLFHRPDIISGFLQMVFKLPVLKRWKHKTDEFGHGLIEASAELRQKNASFWIKTGLATFISWTSRFLVVNALFLIFTANINHAVVFGRQLTLWLVMIISPTPGGSGVSEYAFKQYNNDIGIGSGPVILIIVLWRLLSYYLYLLIGTMIIPRWVQHKFRFTKTLST